MEEGLNKESSANKRLTRTDKIDYMIKDPNLGVKSSTNSEVILKDFENPKVSRTVSIIVCEELATARGQTLTVVNKHLSKCTNNYDDDNPREILCGEDRGKSINGSSAKTEVIYATGVKTTSSLSDSSGNYENCFDMEIQREEEVNCHLVQPSLEAMRERIASYISYSGSESSDSDSETLDLNDKKKGDFQINRITQNKENERSPKNDKNISSLKRFENTTTDRNSGHEKESTFLGDIRKFSMKWNITAKKVESVNSLTPVRGIWDDALISHTEGRSLNGFELRHSSKFSNSQEDKTLAAIKSSEIIPENDDHDGQNETKTFLINDACNRCTSDKRMTLRHDSSRDDNNYSKKAQENALKPLQDERSRKGYKQKLENPGEISSNFKQENGNRLETKFKKDEDAGASRSPRQTANSQNTNTIIINTNADQLKLDDISFCESSSKNQESRTKAKSSSSCCIVFDEDSSLCSSNASPVRRYPKQKHLQIESHAEEHHSATMSSSSDKKTKIELTKRKHKNDVKNKLKCHNREDEENDSTSKQNSPESRRTLKVHDDKETKKDDRNSISNRRQSRLNVSLEKEHWQTKSPESSSVERESKCVKQSHVNNDDETKGSTYHGRNPSASPEKDPWRKKFRERSTSVDRESKFVERSQVDDDDSKGSYYRSRNTRRSASLENERWQKKSRERISLERESKCRKQSHVNKDDDGDEDDDEWKSSARRRNSRRSATPEKERLQRKFRERSASLDTESKYERKSHIDNRDNGESKGSYDRDRISARRSDSPEKEHWQRTSRERVPLEKESSRRYSKNDNNEEWKSSARCRNSRRSVSPEKERRQRSRERTPLERESRYSKHSHIDYDDDIDGNEWKSSSRRQNSRRSASPEKERWQRRSRERTPLERESGYSKHSHIDYDDDIDDNEWKSSSRRQNSRRSASPEKERWQRRSRERTPLERESGYSKHSHIDYDDDIDDNEWKSSSRRQNSRRSASPEKERWQRRSRERTPLERESRYSKTDDDDEWKNSARRNPRRSASPEKERWQRRSRERTRLDRESRFSSQSHIQKGDDVDDNEWKSSANRRNSRRSVSPENERWQRRSRERSPLERGSRYSKHSHIQNDDDVDDNEWKSSAFRNSRRSASPEKERWQRRSRERTPLERESRYSNQSHIDNDDDDEWKSSARRRSSRRSASPEKERWQKRSRESASMERESEHAVGESRNQDKIRFRSPVPPRLLRTQQDRLTRRRQFSEAPDSSWIHNIVVKIADPPRGPIRKRHNVNNRRQFNQRNKVERSSNSTDPDEERRLPEPSTRQDKSEHDDAQRMRKRRWTYDDYTQQSDGSLKRKREFSYDDEEHSAWKRYDDERTMPYQGYADSQVQSLLRQLCGDYLTKLYSKEANNEGKPFSKNDALGKEKDSEDHRSWFMTSSEWISYGVQDPKVEDPKEQSVPSKECSTKTVPIVWHTVPLLTSIKKETDERDGKAKAEGPNEQVNKPKTDKQLSFNNDEKEGSLTPNETVASQTSHNKYQTARSSMSEGTDTFSSVGSESFTSCSVEARDSWNTSSICNDALLSVEMTRNDFLVTVTPSSYWYEKEMLQKQTRKETLSKESTMEHHQSLYIPTSFSSSRQIDVSSFSTCFHIDTSRFDLSPQILDSQSDVDEDDNKARNDRVLELTTPPKTEKDLMENECNIHTSAKRQLDFDSITDSELTNGIETDPTENTLKNHDQETGTRDVDPVCSDSSSKKEISPPGSNSNPGNLQMSCQSSSSGTRSNATDLQTLNCPVANKSAFLENVNIKEGNQSSEVKCVHQGKKDIDQLVEGGNADVNSETNENHSQSTNSQELINEDDDASPMWNVLVEDPESKEGEEMWELALKSKAGETSGDEENTRSVGNPLTKSHPKSGDLDVAIVKPSPRQKYDSSLNYKTSERFAYQDENNAVSTVNPAKATVDKTQRGESVTTKKPPVENEKKNQLISQMEEAKNLEHSKNPLSFSRCFPDSTSGVFSSTPHTMHPLQNIQKAPKELKLNSLDVTKEGVLAVGVDKRVTANIPLEKSAVNMQHTWSTDSKQQGPPQSHRQTKFGYTFQTPNLAQNQQQVNECHMVQSPFSKNNVAQHHMVNSKHLSINASLNAKVIPTLSNRQEIFPEQQGGNLQNQTIFIRDSTMLVSQQHAMMSKHVFHSVDDSFRGLLLGAQNNLSPSMPQLNNTFVGQGTDRSHSMQSLNYPTLPTEPVCFQPSDYQQQLLPPQRQQIHHQRQQQLQEQQQQQQPPQQQQLQQIYHQQEQKETRQHQQRELQQQQQIYRQEQQLQQQQQMYRQEQQQQQQQPHNFQQQQQPPQQQSIPDGLTPIQRHYAILEKSPQLDKWHDSFLNASKIQDDLSHIPWGQHALDLGHQSNLRMLSQYPHIRTPLPQNVPTWFFNTQNAL